jgi:hypothetical protein
MTTPLGDAAAELADLASALVDRWSDRLTTIATNIDDGQYTADEAAGDLAATTSLAVETGLTLVSGTLDAIALLTRQGPPDAATSQLVRPLPGAVLSIEAPFVNIAGSGKLYPSQITIVPDPDPRYYALRAPTQGYEPGAYIGTVKGTLEQPGQPPQVATSRVLLPVQ